MPQDSQLDWKLIQAFIEFDVKAGLLIGTIQRGNLVAPEVKMPHSMPSSVIKNMEAQTFCAPRSWWHRLLRIPPLQYHIKYDQQERSFRII